MSSFPRAVGQVVCAAAHGAAMVGCGGGMPLLHTAAALHEGEATIGAGFAGQVTVPRRDADVSLAEDAIHAAAFSPGLSPWVAGRVGIDGSSEVGLGYFARSLRADYRYVFSFDRLALSLGVGASALLPKRRDDLGVLVGGGGGDVPILVGWCNPTEIYCAWAGVRGGFEILNGQRDLELDPASPIDAPIIEDVGGWHAYGGGLIGMRIGFRYVYAAFELDLAEHFAKGAVGSETVELRQFTLTPAGGIIGRF